MNDVTGNRNRHKRYFLLTEAFKSGSSSVSKLGKSGPKIFVWWVKRPVGLKHPLPKKEKKSSQIWHTIFGKWSKATNVTWGEDTTGLRTHQSSAVHCTGLHSRAFCPWPMWVISNWEEGTLLRPKGTHSMRFRKALSGQAGSELKKNIEMPTHPTFGRVPFTLAVPAN